MKLFYEDIRDSADHTVDCDSVWRLASDEMVLREACEILIRSKLIVDTINQHGSTRVKLEQK